VSEVRVRFAPSPTGYLHVGGARTALFNWLYARHNNGKFLLRIEDTDRKRSTEDAVRVIFTGLKQLGLDWDEEPLYQSTRIEQHRDIVNRLLDSGSAYRCFCESENLARQRGEQEKRGKFYRYPGTCRSLTNSEVAERLKKGQQYAVRFKLPPGRTKFNDMVHGDIVVQHDELDDFIILRQNGTPVYQVAVVADDSYMGITHVIRGDDHISNTPKQILLYQALGLPVPEFAHVPLILGADKKRLSKRHGAASVTEYTESGILPETMLNFLALLGWSPGDDREILTQQEMIDAFNFKRITPKGAVFDETKLQWMNAKHIFAMPALKIWQNIQPHLAEYCRQNNAAPPDESFGLRLVKLFGDRIQSFREAPDLMSYFFVDPTNWDEKGIKKHWKSDTPEHLQLLSRHFQDIDKWGAEQLELCVDNTAEELEIKRAKLIHPLRLVLTGRTHSPGIFEVMELLVKDLSIKRINTGVEWISIK